jgi:hypothetical protein
MCILMPYRRDRGWPLPRRAWNGMNFGSTGRRGVRKNAGDDSVAGFATAGFAT